MKISSGAVLFAIALTTGCATTGHESGTTAIAPSGFLSDYSQLKPAADREGVMLYVDRNRNYRPFTKIMLDPVQVIVTPSPEQPQVPRDALMRISTGFQESLRRALEPNYQIVTTPGPDVLRVRAAITGVQAARPTAGATDYIPLKALYNVGREAAGASPRVPEMAGEMEVLDPAGKRVAAATATRKGDKSLPQGEQLTWESMQSIADYWSRNFRIRLDQLRGVGS